MYETKAILGIRGHNIASWAAVPGLLQFPKSQGPHARTPSFGFPMYSPRRWGQLSAAAVRVPEMWKHEPIEETSVQIRLQFHVELHH